MPRPYVTLSGATSVDGYIDDTIPTRLLLSNSDDFDRVDQVRADSDAILIGARHCARRQPTPPGEQRRPPSRTPRHRQAGVPAEGHRHRERRPSTPT